MSSKSRLPIFQPEESSSSCGSGTVTPIQNEQPLSVSARTFAGRAAIVTLGCAKNQVDSEVMLGVLHAHGFEIVQDLPEADVVVVNTCGFLESSVKESIDAVLNAAEYREKGRLRKLFVAGCAVERYKGELEKTLPEVDGFLSTDDLLKVGQMALGCEENPLDSAARPYFIYDDTMPRVLSTLPHTAYVKVGEGCNRPCTFCIIPRIRGKMRSRVPDSVYQEVRSLAERGVREINLVAQDLTSYGTDMERNLQDGDKAKFHLADLLEGIDALGVMDWVRLLYAYPIGIDERLLNSIVSLPSICNYLDLPLQHASERVLARMKRPLGRYSPRNIVEFIRSQAPEIQLRTTFIVGFPGETEEDIRELEEFIQQGHFANVGIFTYSPEKGTPSFDLDGHLSLRTKTARRNRLMRAQQKIVEQRLGRMVGERIDVLIEGPHEETDLLLSGRSRFQAPEVDGIVLINDVSDVSPEKLIGSIHSVEVTGFAGYDLIGRVVPIN